MSKIKTRKTLSKRIKITKTGKLLRKPTRIGHLKVKWSANHKYRKNGLKEQSNPGHVNMFKKLLGK